MTDTDNTITIAVATEPNTAVPTRRDCSGDHRADES